jgi:sodium-dependent dicarboxylate transporter 2/3/5
MRAEPAHERDADDRESGGLRRRVGLLLGAAFLAAGIALPAPPGLPPEAWRTAACGLLMAVWWVTEAIPIPATALLPLVLFPPLGIAGIDAAASPYANELVFLFLGGFLLARGMERWGLPRRIALRVVSLAGPSPRGMVAGFMVATAFLSMWVSNTATAVMMLPIGISVLDLMGRDEAERGSFSVALMLGIAYAASIGGLGTLIGTPPNAFLAAFLSEEYDIHVGFARWMAFGLPLVLVGLPLTYFVLTRLVFSVRREEIEGTRELLERERAVLGPLRGPERRVAIVFVLVALVWVTRPLLQRVVPGLSDAGIGIGGGLALFLLPAGSSARRALLVWEDAVGLPWGVLLLFGGGLSLASAFQSSGLTAAIGEAARAFSGVPMLALVAVTALIVILLTELTSNTATAAAFLPVLASVAAGIGLGPLELTVPAAVAASCAFMLPVATPPNAIVYGSGVLTVPQMARAGVVLNFLFLVLLVVATWLLLPAVLGGLAAAT